MEVLYSPHAVDRMLQRNISTDEVEIVLNSPDGTIKQSSDKVIFFKKMVGRTDNRLAVVAVQQQNRYEVIAVMVNFEVKP